MADITSKVVIYKEDTGLSRLYSSPFGVKEIFCVTPVDTKVDDYFDIVLTDYGIKTPKSLAAVMHSAEYGRFASVGISANLNSDGKTLRVIIASQTTATTQLVGGSNYRRTIVIGGI